MIASGVLLARIARTEKPGNRFRAAEVIGKLDAWILDQGQAENLHLIFRLHPPRSKTDRLELVACAKLRRLGLSTIHQHLGERSHFSSGSIDE